MSNERGRDATPQGMSLVDELRAAATCVYIAAPEDVARPIAGLLNRAADALSPTSEIAAPSLDRTLANEIRDAIRDAAIEECAKYCDETLAGNHPHAANYFRHAASNLRALKNAAPQVVPVASDMEAHDGFGRSCSVSPAVAAPSAPSAERFQEGK